ncbi:MAG TPA: uroporphyrinogen-III synthase [Rhizomicrobium sp.]|nr:uroporphyrinogen-III synthase [Rhizomicrobium sp.]
MRILVTRPVEDGEDIAAHLAEMGHQALLAPLLTVRFHDGPPLEHSGPGLEDVQAILATSANGVRALARRTARRDFSIFAVGPQTAEEARNCGFTEIKNADGDAKALAEAATRWASRKGVLLHVCGEDAPGTLAENLSLRGFQVRRVVLYAIEPAVQLPPQAVAALKAGALDAAMFFSPRSARIFGVLADGLPTENLAALCISAATAQALVSLSFARVAVAARPNQAAMLALVE